MTSPLGPQIERFLRFKRGLGYRYGREEYRLNVLDGFLAPRLDPEDPVITEDIVRAYVAGNGSDGRQRLTRIRQLCRFLSLEEPRTAVPPPRFLGMHRKPFTPRILTRDEGKAFLKACLCLPPGRCSPLSGTVNGTVIALLYLTGMRKGEALSLNLEDVDLSNGVIRIRQGKFGKSRLVLMAGDLTKRMKECRQFVDRALGKRHPGECFFPGPRGLRCTPSALQRSFRKVLAHAGIPYLGPGKGPRLHDLRHSYTILRMMRWYEQGADLNAKLPVLSTCLGHVGLASSQHYIRLTKDLLNGVLGRYEARFGSLIQERRKG